MSDMNCLVADCMWSSLYLVPAMTTFSQGGVANIKSEQFSGFGSRTISKDEPNWQVTFLVQTERITFLSMILAFERCQLRTENHLPRLRKLMGTFLLLLLERQMVEIWQDCAVCHTIMKFCWDAVFVLLLKFDVVQSKIPEKEMTYGVFKSVMYASLHIFPWRKKWRKIFISDKQNWIHRNKERMERSKMSYCIKLHVSWKWNYRGLKSIFEEAFCVLRMLDELFFYFLSGYDSCVVCGRERCHFLSFHDSFMWCESFCPGRTVYFDDFYFIGKLR